MRTIQTILPYLHVILAIYLVFNFDSVVGIVTISLLVLSVSALLEELTNRGVIK